MKPTRPMIETHLSLHGWSGWHYLTPFEHADGYVLWHAERADGFRTANGAVILRVPALPEGSAEIGLGAIPAQLFQRMYERAMGLRAVTPLGGEAPDW